MSAAVWLGSYVVGPARGRPFFLGAGLIGAVVHRARAHRERVRRPLRRVRRLLRHQLAAFEAPATSSTPRPARSSRRAATSATAASRSRRFDPPDPPPSACCRSSLGVGVPVRGRLARPRGRHGAATPFTFAAHPLPGRRRHRAGRRPRGGRHRPAARGHRAGARRGTAPPCWRRATSWIGGAAMAARARHLPRRHGRRQRHHRRDALHRRRHRDGLRRPPPRIRPQRARRARTVTRPAAAGASSTGRRRRRPRRAAPHPGRRPRDGTPTPRGRPDPTVRTDASDRRRAELAEGRVLAAVGCRRRGRRARSAGTA